MNKRALCLALILSSTVYGAESTKPPNRLSSLTLGARVVKKTFQNSHYRIIGSCTWLKHGKVKPVAAVEQYVPDLVITVSNNPGENPWLEANDLYENALAQKSYQTIFKAAFGTSFDYGSDSAQQAGQHLNDDRSRVVHVIGSPAGLYNVSGLSHQAETRFGALYYSSHADAVMDRSESAEITYMVSHPNLLIGHDIGSVTHSWGPEIPRLMRVTQPSRFRASVVAAMHAVDIVTNEGGLHVRQATTNRCGHNCVVSNVIYDPKHKKVIWQEVYPNNRNINPGVESDFGAADDIAGNGNYVFVVWRKYRGCVKQQGKYISGFPHVGRPVKR